MHVHKIMSHTYVGSGSQLGLYTLLTSKPYYSEFKALVDFLGLNTSPSYRFAPNSTNPFLANATTRAPRTAFIPNNSAMAQAYSALLARAGLPPICANAASRGSRSCGYKLPRNTPNWIQARPDLRRQLEGNLMYLHLLVAGHVLKDQHAFTLQALAPRVDAVSGIVIRPTDAHNMFNARSLLYIYAAR